MRLPLACCIVGLVGCLARPDDVPGEIEHVTSLTFGAVVGSTSYAQRVLLHNVGRTRTARLGVPRITGPGAGNFTVADASECADRIVPASGYCSIWIQFAATDLATATAELQFDAGNDGPRVIQLVGSATSAPTFTASAPISVVHGGVLALGDINTDGLTDIATGSVQVMLNTGDPATMTPTPLGQTNVSVFAVADVDGDAKPDLLGFLPGEPSYFVVVPNTTANGATSATFDPAVSFNIPMFSFTSTFVDFNNDGRPDVMTAGSNTPPATLLNQSTPGVFNFAGPTDTTSYPVTGLSGGDLDGDGKADVVILNGQTKASVLLSASTSTAASFSPEIALPFLPGYSASDPHIGDLNGDGHADVAFLNNESIRIALNSGSSPPAFGELIDIPFSQNQARLLPLADLNRDGRLDLIALSPGVNGPILFLNATPPGSSTPAFAPFAQPVAGIVSLAATGNLGGDSAPDIVIATTSNMLIVLVAD